MKASELKTTEYAPFYATYISKVGDAPLLQLLEEGKAHSLQLFQSIPENKHAYRYAAGKWSIKEVLQHIIDTERVFAYRALRISRGDTTPLPGFEQNGFNDAAKADRRSLADLIAEYQAVREANIQLFRSMTDDMLLLEGTASGYNVSTRAIGFMIVGHEKHHVGIVMERYLD